MTFRRTSIAVLGAIASLLSLGALAAGAASNWASPTPVTATSAAHGEMDHGEMDHGEMDHGATDHGATDHGATDPDADARDDHAGHDAPAPIPGDTVGPGEGVPGTTEATIQQLLDIDPEAAAQAHQHHGGHDEDVADRP